MNSSALCCAWNIVGCCSWCQHLVDDVDDTVACVNICKRDGCIIHHHAVADGEGDGVAVHSGCRQALSDRRGRNLPCYDVVKQDVSESCFAFRCVEGCQINTSISECLVGRSEEREWPISLKSGQQFCLNDSGYEGVVDSSALCCARDVIWTRRGREHLIDDMDDPVACGNISCSDRCVVHHHSGTDGKGEWLAVDGSCRHAVSDSRRGHFSSNDVIEENVTEGCFAFWCIEGCQIDTSISECLVCRGEEREWSGALERFKQFSLDHTSHEGIVNASTLCCAWNVPWCVCGCQNLVNHVNQTVARHNISRNNGRAVNHYRGSDGEGKWLSIGCICRHTVRHIGSRNFCGNHVIEQDILECYFSFWSVEGAEVNASICKRLVGRCKNREWPGTLEGC